MSQDKQGRSRLSISLFCLHKSKRKGSREGITCQYGNTTGSTKDGGRYNQPKQQMSDENKWPLKWSDKQPNIVKIKSHY